MDISNYQRISRFIGINNVDSNLRLQPIQIDNKEFVYPLQNAVNLKIDNTYMIKSRTGYTSVISGTDIHSLWSDGSICLFVDLISLYKMDLSYNTLLITSNLQSKAKMSYVNVNDRIYYTNNFQIGYIKNDTNYSLPNPNKEFKKSLPAGKHIDYFMGCIMVAKENILYISDPLCDYYDIRYGYKIFPYNINMLTSVEGGVYVSTDRIYFMKGLSNEDFVLDDAYPYKAIEYTDVKLNSSFINSRDNQEIAMWTSENGICIGDGSGKVINETEERYILDSFTRGSAIIKNENNTRYYINTLF